MARKIGSNGEETAAAALDAATRLFARRGYEAASMRALAATVGVGPAALYNYWPTKQHLLAEVLGGFMEQVNQELECALPDPAAAERDPADAVRRFVRFFMGVALREREKIFLSYMELRSLSAENYATIVAGRERFEGRLRGIVEAGRRAGVLRVADARIATRAVLAMMVGSVAWYREDGTLPPEAVATLYEELALNALGAGAGMGDSRAGEKKATAARRARSQGRRPVDV